MDSKAELTEEEIKEIREIIEQDKRSRWFWANVRRWGAWAAGFVGALVAFRDDISNLFKGIGQ